MSDKKEKRSRDKVEKERRKSKSGSKEKKQKVASAAFSLLADDKAIDPTLSSLFAAEVRKTHRSLPRLIQLTK